LEAVAAVAAETGVAPSELSGRFHRDDVLEAMMSYLMERAEAQQRG